MSDERQLREPDHPAVDLYLETVKLSLMDAIHHHPEFLRVEPVGRAKRAVLAALRRRGLELVRERRFDPARRAEGKGWPQHAHTMIGAARLDNVRRCVADVLRAGVPGDLIETGVWRGGASIFMKAVLRAYDVTDRRVWVADSFRGLPPPDSNRYPADAGFDLHMSEQLAVSVEEVRSNFERYGLLDDRVVFLEGWFRDTLPQAPIERLAMMRLDGDMYESTIDSLSNLYPKLSPGGHVIVDDYRSIDACRAAVDAYRSTHSITDPIEIVDWSGISWRKTTD